MDTGTNGNYSLNVGNGTWSVGLNLGGCGDCLPANYLCPPTQSVVISNNNGTANFAVLFATNFITGYLKDNTGNPIAGVRIFANDTIGGVFYQSREDTDTNGYYTVNVGNGSWSVAVYCSGSDSDTLDAILGAGNYTCPISQNVTISNNNGTASFTVQPSSFSPLQVTTTSLSNATQNAFYSTTLTATGGQPPYTWGLLQGSASLPLGLSLAANGVISGTPISSGTSEFIVEVTDATNAWNYQLLALTVNASSIPQVIVLTAPEQLGTNQFQFGFNSASGVDYTIQYSTNLKTWTSLLEFSGSGGTETIIDPGAGGSTQRFYRVVVP